MGTQPAVRTIPHRERKPLVRRLLPDRSQSTRHIVQGLFVALNLFIGLQFYLWVRSIELAGPRFTVARPAGVEGWLPIAGLMNLKYLLATGHIPAIHPAALFLFLAFLSISLLLKKAFCSWLCPIGTLSEGLAALGRRAFGRNFRFPHWLDIPLRGLKYLLLAFFVGFIGAMSAQALAGFMMTPYGLVADVKMFNFFRQMSLTAAAILLVLVLASMLVQHFWCRYLCPYGALLGLVSILSPVKIRRDAEACLDCGKCARVCPATLPVDRLVQIRSAECNACMICVAACPQQHALQFAIAPRRAPATAERWFRRVLGPLAVACFIAYLFVGTVLFARATSHWQTNLPDSVYRELVPSSEAVAHPRI